jgi:signal peptidase
MARRIGRAAGYLAWFAALLVALLMAATFIPTVFGLESLIVASGSMNPAMPVGSVALTREVDARAVSTGDIISFRHRGSATTTTHRVIAIKVEASQVFFTTKGDANPTADPEQVIVDARIHKVEHVVPEAGYVVRYARSPIGAFGLFLLPLLGLAHDRRSRQKRRPRSPAIEIGWSSTTLSLLRLTPDPMGSDPSG